MISATQTDRSLGVVSLHSTVWQAAGQLSSLQPATSAGLLPFLQFSCQVISLSLPADRLPRLSSPHAKLPASHRAGTSFLSFGYKPYALLTGSPLPSPMLSVLLSVSMLLSPPFGKQADRLKVRVLAHGAGAAPFSLHPSAPCSLV